MHEMLMPCTSDLQSALSMSKISRSVSQRTGR